MARLRLLDIVLLSVVFNDVDNSCFSCLFFFFLLVFQFSSQSHIIYIVDLSQRLVARE